MKIKRIILSALAALLLFSGVTWAADTVTVTDKTYDLMNSKVRKIAWTFSSDDGTIARTSTYTVNGTAGKLIENVWGTIVKVHYQPDGINTPDAAADVQLFPALATGANLLVGLIDNVGATETIDSPETATLANPVFLGGDTLYFYAASLGAGTNGGILTIWVLMP